MSMVSITEYDALDRYGAANSGWDGIFERVTWDGRARDFSLAGVSYKLGFKNQRCCAVFRDGWYIGCFKYFSESGWSFVG